MIHIQETYLNQSEGYIFGETPVYETYTDSKGELFRSLQREYGRCTSAIYIDVPGGKPRTVGWVFERKEKYEDTGETYTREVWVTLHSEPPTKTITYHYLDEGE